ncbi:MAG: hypothetical protein HN600_11475, partial [Bacteroidetes bacterium]|nr:hypothetical protein [Bacteroidota bacterium]
MGKFITVVRFQFPPEAFVIKSKLESEGIEVILQDEQLIQVHNYLSNAIGGIKLQVKESDVTKALPIIKAAGLINSTNDVSDTNLQIWISKKLAKSPLLRQLSLANRLVLHLFILVVLFATLIFTFTLPTKEEKRIVQAEHEQFEAQLKFDQFYLPYADSLTANDPTKAIT